MKRKMSYQRMGMSKSYLRTQKVRRKSYWRIEELRRRSWSLVRNRRRRRKQELLVVELQVPERDKQLI